MTKRGGNSWNMVTTRGAVALVVLWVCSLALAFWGGTMM